jgi:probable HAF family extracellular repeat protein
VFSVKNVGFLLIFAAVAAANPIYTVANLGVIDGSATGYAINSSGTVAGWAQNPSGGQQAFISTPSGLQALSSGPYESYAYGINNSGTVVGTTYDASGQAHGTIWSASGTTVLGAGSYAMAINAAGEVVGGNGQAFAMANGQVQTLATVPGVNWSAAYAINNGGTIVGDGQLANGTFRGIIWNPDGSTAMLGTFGGSSSQATGVNDSGQVVGFASLPDGYQNAFSEIDGTMLDLGTLGGGSSYAYGVNNIGEIVGYSWLADGGQSAFLYDDGTMFDLNSLLPNNSGWDLLQAYGINASGQITGVGLYDGQLSAFLLTDPPAGPVGIAAVPEPREILILGASMALIAILRSRRARAGVGRP